MLLKERASSATSGDALVGTGTRASSLPSASERDACVRRRIGWVSHCASRTAATIVTSSASTAAVSITLAIVWTVWARVVYGFESVAVMSRSGPPARRRRVVAVVDLDLGRGGDRFSLLGRRGSLADRDRERVHGLPIVLVLGDGDDEVRFGDLLGDVPDEPAVHGSECARHRVARVQVRHEDGMRVQGVQRLVELQLAADESHHGVRPRLEALHVLVAKVVVEQAGQRGQHQPQRHRHDQGEGQHQADAVAADDVAHDAPRNGEARPRALGGTASLPMAGPVVPGDQRSAKAYPAPRTVRMKAGSDGSSSSFSRRWLTWTLIVFSSWSRAS